MSLLNVFDIAGTGMSAQTLRLGTTASNLGNADVPAGKAEEVYKARYPIFEAIQKESNMEFDKAFVGVKVSDIIENDETPRKRYQPSHALADQDGYIYMPSVNVVEEMANMISASRSYQMNVQMVNTAKQMMQRTLQLGQ